MSFLHLPALHGAHVHGHAYGHEPGTGHHSDGVGGAPLSAAARLSAHTALDRLAALPTANGVGATLSGTQALPAQGEAHSAQLPQHEDGGVLSAAQGSGEPGMGAPAGQPVWRGEAAQVGQPEANPSPGDSRHASALGEGVGSASMATEASPLSSQALDAAVLVPMQDETTPLATLQHMAQTLPRQDIARERHGAAGERWIGAAAEPHAHAASTPADAQATPSVRDAQMTAALASLLYTEASRLRTEAHAPQLDDDNDEPPHRRPREPADEDDAPDSEAAALHSESLCPAPGTVVPTGWSDSGTDADGDPALYRRIVDQLGQQAARAPAVAALLEELRRQRCAVWVSPAGPGGGLRGLAHVDVLRPSHHGGRALRLQGELLWAQCRTGSGWLGAHLVKSQAPGQGRQLVPVAGHAHARCVAVCLGPQAIPMTAWSQACVRVREATRLWRALEPQWSLRMLISEQSQQQLGAAAGGPHVA